MEFLKFDVTDDQSGVRIDRFLSENTEELSRSYLQKLIKEQKVLVNSIPAKSSYKVQAKDLVTVELPQVTEPDILPEDYGVPSLSRHNPV